MAGENAAMSRPKLALAIAAGLALGTLPFLRYVHLGHPALPHSDHEPRHGGQLVMVGNHHIELLRGHGNVEVFVSDAHRVPVQPVRGHVVYDDGPREILVVDGDRMRAPDVPRAVQLEVTVVLPDGTPLSWRFARPAGAGFTGG